MADYQTQMLSNSEQIVSDEVNISKRLIVNDRDILNELDNLHKSMLLLPRDQKLEDKYPELKEAYDSYLELYRGLLIADKMANT